MANTDRTRGTNGAAPARTVTLTGDVRNTLLFAELDQVTGQLDNFYAQALRLRDMRTDDPTRSVLMADVLSGISLGRQDLDAVEALLAGEAA